MPILLQGTPLPSWLVVVMAIGGLAGYAVGILTFLDRRRRERTADIKTDTKEIKQLEVLGWSLAERLALEKRLAAIEAELASQKELHALLEKLMANILHSPHRPELDRLLEKIDEGRKLSDAEVMFLADWLHQIATDPTVSKGEQTAASILLALVNIRCRYQGALH